MLAVLARTDQPLSGRQVAALTNGRVGQWRANEVLVQLAEAGIVLREHRPPAKLHRLNHEHVAAAGIIALAGQREELFSRMRAHAAAWSPAPQALWLFGSAARGDGGSGSDVDLLAVRPEPVDADDPAWLAQVDDLSTKVSIWSGNSCEVLELSAAELTQMTAQGERLIDELRADGVLIAGSSPRALLRLTVTR
ncbi:MAG TPA: nucleotidyltransferase domain-containing protein [Actinomycetales bacterium]|nr:nucleotidyltransferase domain-containing protein [Actinomycetales bacterium]